jgi:predicted porin
MKTLAPRIRTLAIPVCMISLQAAAQASVTLYGVVDEAFSYSSNQLGSSNVYTRTGNLLASRFGLRGVEPLTSTTSAIFDLQEGFDAGTGTESNPGLIFHRQAYVGLQDSELGTLTMGRQYSAYYQFLGPMGPVSTLTGATGAHPGDVDGFDTTIRINNSVLYISPPLSGFSAAAQYGFGEIPGTLIRGSTVSTAVRYVGGPLAVGVGFLRLYNTGRVPGNDPAASGNYGSSSVTVGFLSARVVQYLAAAGTYRVGAATVGLNYSNVQFQPESSSLFADTAIFNNVGVIGNYEIGQQVTVAAGYSYTRATASNGIEDPARYHQISLKQVYHLSKTTSLYALQAYQRARGKTLGPAGGVQIVNATATVGDSQNGLQASGGTQFVGMLGIAHAF